MALHDDHGMGELCECFGLSLRSYGPPVELLEHSRLDTLVRVANLGEQVVQFVGAGQIRALPHLLVQRDHLHDRGMRAGE